MKNLVQKIVISVIFAGCSVDMSGTGTGGVVPAPTTSSPEVPRGDSFPLGAVAHFQKVACPADWTPYDAAVGRVMISASETLPRGTLIGDPLASGENREHEHEIAVTVAIPETQIAGIEGGGNGGMTPVESYNLGMPSSPVAADVPYVQLLACKKAIDPAPNALPLPAKLQTYFDLDACPSGWKQVAEGAGRIIVGLPPDAMADQSFGGEPITTPDPRTHTHSVETALVTSPHGVALVSGCCGKFGQNGTHPVVGKAVPASVGIPMIALLHCEKQ